MSRAPVEFQVVFVVYLPKSRDPARRTRKGQQSVLLGIMVNADYKSRFNGDC